MGLDDFRNIFMGPDLNWNTPIMRYTSLLSLAQILELKFFVQERNQFDKIDGHENGKYEEKGLGFPFSQIERPNATQCNEKERLSEQLMSEIAESHKKLISCWTLSQKEKTPMWKGKDVLIKSTIGKFLMSLNIQYVSSIICGKVQYSDKEQIKSTLKQFLFLKEGNEYKCEEELRFYIDSDMRNGVNVKGEPDDKSAILPLNNNSFIDAIVFNPLLSASQEKESLIDKYPFVIKLIQASELL